jgi:quinol monooxygenase YgiN
MIVRISAGRFDATQFDDIDRTLRSGGERLVPQIRKLPGCLHYYAAIDRDACTIVNVSVWDSLEHAKQMAGLEAMRAEAALMGSKGVRFEPIVNYETAWTIAG